MKRYRLTRGFTIVEMLVYMGLLMVFLAVLSGLFSSILDVQVESATSSAADQDARYILSRLIYDIGRAESVTTPASPGQSGQTLTVTIGGTSVSYAVSVGNLLVTDGSGTNRINSIRTAVSNLTFTRLGPPGGKPVIRVGLTVESTTERTGGPEMRTVSTSVGIR